MTSPLRVDAFCEDIGFEEFLRALAERLGAEAKIPVRVSIRSARGGQSRVMSELELYARTLEQGRRALPEIIVVGIDSNCHGWAARSKEIQDKLTTLPAQRVAVACPEPHVEKWYLADPDSFQRVVGERPRALGQAKCGKQEYKDALRSTLTAAGHVLTQNGYEFASELVSAMKLYRASQNDRSLKAFIADFRRCLRLAANPDSG